MDGSASAIGGKLTADPLVRRLSFTGSIEIGRLLAAQSSQSLKKLSLARIVEQVRSYRPEASHAK